MNEISNRAIGRHKILADPLDRPASCFGQASTLDKRRKHRAGRVRENHAGRGRILCHEAPNTGHEDAIRPDPDNNGIDVALHLAKDLRTGRGLVRLRIGGIGELIDEERARRTRSDVLREVLIIVRMAAADVRARMVPTHRS